MAIRSPASKAVQLGSARLLRGAWMVAFCCLLAPSGVPSGGPRAPLAPLAQLATAVPATAKSAGPDPDPGDPQEPQSQPRVTDLEAEEALRADRDAYPVFVWRSASAPADDAERALLEPFGGAQVNGGDPAEWLRAAGLDHFIFNAPGRNVLHLDRDEPGYRARWKAWYDGRDDVNLTRSPCLTEPTTRALLFELLTVNLAARDGDTGYGISLGDEVSLTPAGAPEDVCLSPSCRRAWTEFLLGRRELSEADREALADPADFSTDRARKALADGNTEPLLGWLLRREFHQQVVIDLLEELARAARTRAPLAPVGLLGLSGQTAFGNVSVERSLPFVDFIECYPVGNARELAFTLRDRNTKTWNTVFVDPALPNRASWQAWMHWIRGGDGMVVWSGRDLATFPRVADRLAATVADIRSIEHQVGSFRPRPRGVALVHSPRSAAVSWLKDALLDGPTWPRRLPGFHAENGTLEVSMDAWLRFFEDQGLMPGALPFDEVGGHIAQRFPTLVLSHTLVVDELELARLYEYLEAGGTVLVHGQVGWIDGRGEVREPPLLEELLESSTRVLVAPDIIDEYPVTRTRVASARREVLELRLWAYLNSIRKRLDVAPFRVHGDHAEELPWITTWERDRQSGGWLCATLPNAAGEVEHKRLERDIPMRVEPRAGLQLEWIHPMSGVDANNNMLLPPGNAAIFRLLPKSSSD